MTPAQRVARILAEAVGSDLDKKKVCMKCGIEFTGDRCKPCLKIRMAKYYILNREKQIAKATAYNQAHTAERKAYRAAYYQENRNVELARAKKWATDNKERVVAMRKSYRLANIEYAREKCRRYRKEKPEAKRISEQNRRAKKRLTGGRLSRDLTQKLFKAQKGKCACCGLPLGTNYHLDHMMPLHLGGRHEDSNMQLLRSKCNHEKHAKHPVDFMQERGFLL